MNCDYKGCQREMVSGGNLIIDEEGEDYNIDLCRFHLNKLIHKEVHFKNGK